MQRMPSSVPQSSPTLVPFQGRALDPNDALTQAPNRALGAALDTAPDCSPCLAPDAALSLADPICSGFGGCGESGEPTDPMLMQQYANGRVEAFDLLYTRHALGVWRYIFRSVRDTAVADDLSQDVWFAVARQAVNYRATARFKTWLFTLAHHRKIDYFRGVKNHVSLDEENCDDTTLADRLAADSGFGPLRQLESREQGAALIAAIEQLPTEQRDAFLLQVEGDLSVDEIAATCGVSFETAKSRLRYARQRLRQLLEDFA